MKKSLIILSVMGLSATQANASVQQSSYQISSNRSLVSTSSNNASNSNTMTMNSYATISNPNKTMTIEDLQSQLQTRNKTLTQLQDEQLKKYPETSLSFGTNENTASASFVIDSSAPPAIAAARASRSAKSRTVGLCARYVRKALQSAGYEFTPNPSAYQYATRGTLSNAGFVKISNNLPPQVGDVVVYNRSAKHRHGHIQIFDGTQWVSDFRQRTKNPYSGNYSYTTWRDARYLNDASANQDVYLALND